MKHGWMMFLLIVPVLMSGIGSDSGNPAGRDLRTWRLHEVIYQIYDFDSGTSLNDKRFTVYYNQPDDIRIDSMAVDVWDNFLQIWIPDVITSYHYDQTGEYILRADVCYAGNPVPITQRFCRYDNQNRLKEVLSYGYNSTSQSYDLRGGDYFDYDDSHVVSYINVLHLAQPIYSRYTYQNDASGRHISYAMDTSSDSLSWFPLETGEITYHAQDTSTGEEYNYYLSHHYQTDLLRTEGFYGKVAAVTYQSDWNGSSFDYLGRYLYEYDMSAQLTNRYVQFYGADWVSVTNDAYAYDAMANLSQIAYMNWDFVAGEWGTPYEKHLINWEQMTSAEDNTVPQVTARLSVYPTPFAGSVSITLHSKSNTPVKAEVYNIKGRLIKTLSGSKIPVPGTAQTGITSRSAMGYTSSKQNRTAGQ
jgi:hypothetical protein